MSPYVSIPIFTHLSTWKLVTELNDRLQLDKDEESDVEGDWWPTLIGYLDIHYAVFYYMRAFEFCPKLLFGYVLSFLDNLSHIVCWCYSNAILEVPEPVITPIFQNFFSFSLAFHDLCFMSAFCAIAKKHWNFLICAQVFPIHQWCHLDNIYS